jgi:hypothetical protein
MDGSEITAADLNQDNLPELVLTTNGDPDNISPDQPHGYLMILDAAGNMLHDIQRDGRSYQPGVSKTAIIAPCLNLLLYN